MEHRKIALMFCFIPKTDLGAGLVLHLTLADRRISQADSPKNRKEATPKIDTTTGTVVLFSCSPAVSGRQVVDLRQAEMCSTLAETPKAAKAHDLQEAPRKECFFFSFRLGVLLG